MITRFLEEHQTVAGTKLITCFHHDVSLDVPLLRAAAERYGGQVLEIRLGADPPRPGPIDPTRQALVEGVLTARPTSVPGALALTLESGDVVATFVGARVTPTDSSNLLLQAAAVVSSDILARSDLTILVVDQQPLDAPSKELLWSLLTIDPDVLGLAPPKLLIVVFNGWPDPEIDYARTPALRYVALPDRLLKRVSTHAQRAYDTLARDSPVVLFLGAGASKTAGIPLGDTYRDRALAGLLNTDGSGSELAEAFYTYLHDEDRFIGDERVKRDETIRDLTLERVLRETFHSLGGRPRAEAEIVRVIQEDCARALSTRRRGRVALQQIMKELRGRLVVITVNFDRLIEEDAVEPVSLSYRPEHFEESRPDLTAYLSGDPTKPVPVLKLHGSVEDPGSLVATVDLTWIGLDNRVRASLNAILDASGDRPIPWVWIGCSMRDRDVGDWLRGIGPQRLDEWWVDPFPGASLDAFVQECRDPVWRPEQRSLHDRLIIESADSFLVGLLEHLRGA